MCSKLFVTPTRGKGKEISGEENVEGSLPLDEGLGPSDIINDRRIGSGRTREVD